MGSHVAIHFLFCYHMQCVPASASLVNLENVGLLLEWITTLKGHTTGSKHQCDTPTKVRHGDIDNPVISAI